jgi:hypothetical protein
MGLELNIKGSDGRRYESLAEMIQSEGEQLISDQEAAVERAIKSQVCSVHGEHPSVVRRATSEGTRLEISACCDDLLGRAQRAAGSAIG